MRPDEERVTRLVHNEARGLLAYFIRRVRQPADAADLLSQTLLVIWRRVEKLPTDDAGARMWMYGVANRVLADHRRGEVRRSALTERLRTELMQTPNPDIDATVDVRAALARLHPLDAEIIRLVHWEGFTHVQVATVLGKRSSTIRSCYHRARTQLRSLLYEAGAHRGQDTVSTLRVDSPG